HISLLHTIRTVLFFSFNDNATPDIYTLSLHDALPICTRRAARPGTPRRRGPSVEPSRRRGWRGRRRRGRGRSTSSRALSDDLAQDRKSTRLNSSHVAISYAVFCLKKKKSKC